MIKKISLGFLLGAALLLIGCGSESPNVPPTQAPTADSGASAVQVESTDNGQTAQQETAEMAAPPAVGAVDAGKASVTGSIYSITYDQPIKGIPVSLSEVVRDENGEGVYVYDPAFSPTTDSVEGGYFVIENVDPGEYVVVVGNVEVNSYVIISEPSGLPTIFNAPADRVTDFSEIRVEGLEIYVVGPEQVDPYPAPDAGGDEGYPEPESDS